MALDRKRARELAKKSAAVRKRKAEERRQSKRRKQQAARLHRQSMTIIDALSLWPEFDAPSWDAWKAFLKALFGLPLSESDLETFARHTGRTALLDLSAYPDPTGHTPTNAMLCMSNRRSMAYIKTPTAPTTTARRRCLVMVRIYGPGQRVSMKRG
jgi:hypothetical protein